MNWVLQDCIWVFRVPTFVAGYYEESRYYQPFGACSSPQENMDILLGKFSIQQTCFFLRFYFSKHAHLTGRNYDTNSSVLITVASSNVEIKRMQYVFNCGLYCTPTLIKAHFVFRKSLHCHILTLITNNTLSREISIVYKRHENPIWWLLHKDGLYSNNLLLSTGRRGFADI